MDGGSIRPNAMRDRLKRLQELAFDRETRDRMIAEMRSMGSTQLFPVLSDFLRDPDSEMRCLVSETMTRIDPQASVPLLLPLLDDCDWVVRVEVCGLLHDIADQRAVPPLIERLRTDPDPMVRNTAAYALGGIGDPTAIPALIESLDHDHELDELGYSTSGRAATALDSILNTNHTRIKLADGLCTMQPVSANFELLKMQAMELYRNL